MFSTSGKSVTRHRSGTRRARGALATGALVVVILGLAACTGSHTTQGTPTHGNSSSVSTGVAAPTGATTSSSSSGVALAFTTTPAPGATKVNPTAPISLSITSGTLTSVVMKNAAGKAVNGTIDASNQSWKTTEVLGYDKTYTITATAQTSGGTATKTVSFSTLKPGNLTEPYMDRIGGYALTNGATFGVAIVPVIHFDEQITNEVAAQNALKVTSTPAVAGAWYWLDDTDVAYRPQNYWATGTKVTVAANVYGVEVGPGLYGQSDVSSSFTVGRKQITEAYDNSPKVDKIYVYNAAGTVLRTMDTSMGQHSSEIVNGQKINFYTLNGDYTVLDFENPANMSSQSYGLPQNDPHGYGTIEVPYSTKISIDGIYLHEYNSTIYDQEHGRDVSEGCLNLKTSDAVWFFTHSLAGDPVVVHGAKGAPTIKLNEGGEWSVPWSTWVAGNASA